MNSKFAPSRVPAPGSPLRGGSRMPRQNSLIAPTTLIPVPDSSAVGDVRRFVQSAADILGFDETRKGEVSIVGTELATNIVRHAKDGAILVRVLQSSESSVLDLLAIDRGPGMRDVARCLEDGYSTMAGGSGTGLGAIRRLADYFDIHSVPVLGSAVLARFGTLPHGEASMLAGALSLPHPGETACGDAWDIDL